ncbi:hypothetical protein TrST_g4354 [Triparma strigata]|uniref:Uncharacterized protein n=2 Tax=Triparma TaxID=722752 RepID=A0A9W7B3S7_9STRA|nr:hypothetical protein TrST_g4354 [Triparma strigata]
MYYSLLAGGKRIRPVACLLSYDMFKTKQDRKQEEDSLEERYKAVMPTAVSLEMIHTMSLIHDDLPSMDDDDLRRGKPTCHVVYGEDVAILAGDSLLSSAFEYAIKYTPIPSISGENKAERLLDVVGRLGASVGNIGLAGGQVMDLECEGKPSEEVTIEDLRWIHLHKTAALLKVACASGAILGGASESDVAKVETFAEKIGLAFQVADDILDCTASSEELGKTAGKDEMVDKATYVRLLGLEGAKAEAQRLTDEAKECLSEWGEEADGLRAIADFIISRSN